MMATDTTRARLLIALLAALALVCALEGVAYWPGQMTWDSIRQYGQALSGDFDDWHPPAMEWLWRCLLPVAQGPATMLAVQLLLYWGGVLLLVGRAARIARGRLAVMIALGAAMPVVVVLMATIIKDSLMAGLLMLAAGILAWLPREGKWWARGIALALLVAAATLRFNALPACLPLAVALLPASWRTGGWRFAAAAIVPAIVLALAMPVANRALDARPSGVGLSLVIFDLGGITYHSGHDVFPPIAGVADPVAVNRHCYSPARWDPYSWWVAEPCPIGFDSVGRRFIATGESPYRHWLAAVVAHPLAYAGHRLAHFNLNSRFLVHDEVERPVQMRIPPNDWGYHLTPSALLTWLDRLARWSAHTPLGWPIWWMAVAGAALALSPAMPSRRLIVPLALSGLLYGLGYLPASVAAELRYHLWTVLAAMLAAVLTVNDLLTGARAGRGRTLVAMAPVVVVTLLCVVWRLT